MTETRKRKAPLRVKADPTMYRRGDRLRDIAGLPWVVLSSDRILGREVVVLETVGGGLRREFDAEKLSDWSRSW